MSKVRVYELAREIGVPSKEVLKKAEELGEFVKSASSTIEPPVARKLREAFPKVEPKPEAEKPAKKAAKKAPAKTAATKKAADAEPAFEAPSAEEKPAGPVIPSPSSLPGAPKPKVKKQAAAPEAAPADSAPAPKAPAAPAARPAGPRPGNNPFGVSGSTPRPSGPRPGNNPFSSGGSSGMGRSGEAAVAGAPRPNPGMMPGRPGPRPGAPGARGGRPGAPGRGPGAPGRGPRPGARPGAPTTGAPRPGAPARSGSHAGAGAPAGPGGPGGAPGGFGGGRGRGGRPGPGGRGNTAGAFGRPGGRPARGRKSKRAKRQEFDSMQAPSATGTGLPMGNGESIRLARGASLMDVADKVGGQSAALVTLMFKLGEMVTATQSLNDETLQILGAELNYEFVVVSPEDEDRELLESFSVTIDDAEDEDQSETRPPVVTVMGHVDHGKTRLLDAIRKTRVGEGEAGGITQHIGAYQISVPDPNEPDHERAITFIDTPGHEAFTAMRVRGAQATDIVILVVAADDGVKPQTIEAVNHAKAAEVPIVVAVNKIDKDGADPTKVRGQLTEYGLVPEEYGGDTMFVDISAKNSLNIENLLDAVLLTADAALELHANPDRDAQGVVVEAHLDRGRGSVATVLVQRGTLRPGDSIVAGDAFGRVRAMLDEDGQPVEEALPSRPVQVLGLTSVPGAGDSFLVVPEDRVARQIAQTRAARERNAQLAQRRGRRSLEDFLKVLETGEVSELKLILKGDTSGSVEALEDSLAKIEVDDSVSLQVIDRGVGAITEANVMLAAASDAVIIGFNVRTEGKSREIADREGVEIRYYSVIYQAIEEVEAALKGLLKPEYEEVQLGSAEVREVFRSSRFGNIAGSLVREGLIRRNAKARLVRDGAVVAENLTINSLRRFKDDATEVREGYECGIGLGSFNDIKEGDVIEAFEMREKPRD